MSDVPKLIGPWSGKMAALLASYEMDEPHVCSPDLDAGDEKDQHYPEFTEELVREWASQPHSGDCTNEPHACNRCYIEQVIHKTNWLSLRMEKR